MDDDDDTSLTYMIDALEMPSQHLSSDPMLAQALAITEAAVLVYDVGDPKSLQLAVGIAEFVSECLGSPSPSPSPTPTPNPNPNPNGTTSNNTRGTAGGGILPTQQREYALMLVGNKADLPDPGDGGSKGVNTSPGTSRVVSRSQGAAAAAGIKFPSSSSGCSFLEVSAKTGMGIDAVFPRLGSDILRLRLIAQRRRDQAVRMQAERMMAAANNLANGGVDGGVNGGGNGSDGPRKRSFGLWRTLMGSTGFGSSRREGRAGSAY